VIQRYAYNAPPYPTSYALVDALREETPPQMQYLIKDLFEDITLFSNRTLDATAVKRTDGNTTSPLTWKLTSSKPMPRQ